MSIPWKRYMLRPNGHLVKKPNNKICGSYNSDQIWDYILAGMERNIKRNPMQNNKHQNGSFKNKLNKHRR